MTMRRPVKQSSTTQLPKSILEQLDAQSQVHNGQRNLRGPGSRKGLSRKEQRQQERNALKERKAQFFSSRPSLKRPVADVTEAQEPPQKRRRSSPIEPSSVKETAKNQKVPDQDKPTIKPQKISKPAKSLDGAKALKLVTGRSHADDDEDAYIAMLEGKLGVKKGSGKKSGYGSDFEEDGLLDLLDSIDVSGDDEDGQEDDDMNSSSDPGDSDEDEEVTDDSSSEDSSEDLSGEADEGDGEWGGLTSEATSSPEHVVNEMPSPKTDISTGTKYVPPHLRERGNPASEDIIKLSRKLKGLLNRLSEQNIAAVLKDIQDLYQSHRRHDLTSALTDLILRGTASHSMLLDSYVALHAALSACLHKVIGIDFAAYFVQNLVSSFETHYAATMNGSSTATPNDTETSTDGKECSNLLVLLTELYNFQVVSAPLLYDIIRLLLEGDLREVHVELLLKVAQSCGPQLRQDDPSALKDIIAIVHSKLDNQTNTSSRTRFMVETLTNLKNNKVKRTAPQAAVETDRLKKFVANLGKTHAVRAHEPLRVSLADLHQADSKGKWWLVGAAWSGNPLVDRQEAEPAQDDVTLDDSEALATKALLKLARKQGMNTDVRRSVFVTIMSSEDYVDACERLSQLGLKDVQEREVMRVLLQCCGNEKTFNPYYALIGQKLAQTSHSHKITLQFCLWDFLRAMGEAGIGTVDASWDEGDVEQRVSQTRLANVAKIYAWWIARGAITLTVLKPLDFLSLKRQTLEFLKRLFEHIFIFSQDQSINALSSASLSVPSKRDRTALQEIMTKTGRLPDLSRGLIFYLSSVFRDEDEDGVGAMEDFMSWACDAAVEMLRSGPGQDIS